MLNLGVCAGFPSENVSSATKGESVADTIRVVSTMHRYRCHAPPQRGCTAACLPLLRIPVINAASDGHQHPPSTPDRPDDHSPPHGQAG